MKKKDAKWIGAILEIKEPLHLRPLQALSATALNFKSEIEVLFGENSCSAKSFLDLIDFAANVPDAKKFYIRANGPDAGDAIEAIMALGETIKEFGALQESVAVDQK